jgi:hypothetical protein
LGDHCATKVCSHFLNQRKTPNVLLLDMTYLKKKCQLSNVPFFTNKHEHKPEHEHEHEQRPILGHEHGQGQGHGEGRRLRHGQGHGQGHGQDSG